MANKCKHCNSCLTRLYHNNLIYYYCSLCIKLYELTPEGLNEVHNQDLIKEMRDIHGYGLF
jgi:hypothetical protein